MLEEAMSRALPIRVLFGVALALSSAGCVRTDGYRHFPFAHPSMTTEDLATPSEQRVRRVLEGTTGAFTD